MGLNVKDLYFSYGKGHDVLSDISFNIPDGQVLSLLGPNGTGKTTLLKCVSGIFKPQKGKVLVDDIDILSLPYKKRASLIGYVPQNTSSVFPLSVADTIMMGRTAVSGRIKNEDKDIVFDIIKKLNLENLSFAAINKISGGQRQRVFIGRALAQRPKLIVLDEPTSSLDLKNQLMVLELICRTAKEYGTSVLMSVHDLNLCAMFSDKVLIINNSKVFSCGSPKDVISEESVMLTYGVNSEVEKSENDVYIKLLRYKKE